jgi:2-octaprenyl-6-methoxyphenol hydroxylase
MLDVAIVGAGPVGATLAALLADSGLQVAVFEARADATADGRTLALAHASRERLEEAGAWPAQCATPITSIHVSQRGGPGRTLIEAREQGVPALGYTVAYTALESALVARLRDASVPLQYSSAVDAIELSGQAARLRFAAREAVEARLLVLADGGANASRIPGIAFSEKDYAQLAIVCALRSDRPHAGRAYERFTPVGPMALLPVEQRYALVWTAAPAQAQRLLGLPDADFLAELQAQFGDRAGRFEHAGPRASFPLRLRAVNTPVALRTAIIGNAAQALHPIAGQGLNLGLRDAAQLAAQVRSTPAASLGAPAMLAEYRAARRRDSGRGIAFTDLLVSVFSDTRRIPTWGRGLALTALDLVPPARRLFAERMMRGAPAP